jgi:hypothetical protein
MIGIRPSDEPVLNAAPAAARGDHEAVRAAIAQSEELAAQGGLRSLPKKVQRLFAFYNWSLLKPDRDRETRD